MSVKHLFKRGPALGLRIFVFALLALVAIIADHRSVHFHAFRNRLAVVVVPIQQMVDAPIRLFSWLGSGVTAQQHLLADNARLRARELLLQSRLQKVITLERENAQLRRLLSSASKLNDRVIEAQLLAVSLNPILEQMVLDKGSNKGVYPGQPVLDGHGVMGQVVNVGPLTSKVLLLTDSRSAIPVQDARSGLRAIAAGQGRGDHLALLNVMDLKHVQVGDVFVTSGLGLHFPIGYPVGVVTTAAMVSGQRFASVYLAPTAHLNQTQQVLLVWPGHQRLLKAVHRQLKKPLPGHVTTTGATL